MTTYIFRLCTTYGVNFASRFLPPHTAVPISVGTSSPRFDAAGREHAPASVLVALYIGVSTIPLLLAVLSGRATVARLIVHTLFAAVALWSARTRWPGADTSVTRMMAATIAVWVPLLLIPGLYNEVPHVAAGFGGTMHDARVIRWEHAMFGVSPVVTLSAWAPWRALSETLHAGYLSYYALIYGPPLRLFLMSRRRDFGETAFTVMLAFVCCYVAFAVFPVQGPWFEWSMPTTIPRGPVRLAVEHLLHAGSSRGTAFPSSHVAVSVSQTIVTLRLQHGLGVAALVCTTALACGAVYGALHYGIDVVIGALLGVAVASTAPLLYARIARRLPAA